MPLPPPISSTESGRGPGSWKSPSAGESPTTSPGSARSTRKLETSPSGWRLVVISIVAPRPSALVAGAVDLNREVDELAGAEAVPDAVRAQLQGDALLGPVVDRDDLGPALA